MHTPGEAALLGHYLTHLADRGRSARTIGDYARVLRAFWAHAGKPPGECTRDDLRAFLDRPTQHGPVRRLAESSRATYAATILAAYHWAAAAGELGGDPLAGAVKPTVHPGPPRALDLADVGGLLRAAREREGERAHLTVWLAYGCGLRVSELAALRIEDCSLGRRPHVRVHGKGRRERLVPLHPAVVAVLAAALAGRPQVGPVLESKVTRGAPVSARTVSEDIRRSFREAKVAATPHQLRHSFATELLAAGNGTNLRAVSRLLGHASTVVTERYTSAFDADAVAAVALLPDPRACR